MARYQGTAVLVEMLVSVELAAMVALVSMVRWASTPAMRGAMAVTLVVAATVV